MAYPKGKPSWNRGMKNWDKKICPVCNKEFENRPSYIRRQKYCSINCSSKAYRGTHNSKLIKIVKEERRGFFGKHNPNWKGGKTKKICIICDKTFETWPNETEIMCCSKKCANRKAGDKLHKIFKEKMKDENYKQKWLKKMRLSVHTKPNKPEKVMIDLIDSLNIKFEYVGDGSFYVSKLNPDFVNKEKKLIIEVFGDYWHNPKKNNKFKEVNSEEYRSGFYKNHGYKMIVIWENELYNDVENVSEKIINFNRGD